MKMMKIIFEIPARLITNPEIPFSDLGQGWIAMQTTRPILGNKIIENSDFTGGFFYVAIDLSCEFAEKNIENNKKMGAHINVFVSEEQKLNAALFFVPEKYRKTYAEMIVSGNEGVREELFDRLEGKKYGELLEALS